MHQCWQQLADAAERLPLLVPLVGAAWVSWVEVAGTVLAAEWERWPEAAPERPFEASWVQAMREEELYGNQEHSLTIVDILKEELLKFLNMY